MIRLHVFQSLIVSALLVSAATAMATPRQAWTFDVYLDDQAIGQHHFELYTRGATRYISIDANFDVRVLFLSVYQYRHDNYEVWQGQCLKSINASTDDNGDKTFVDGQVDNGVLHLRSTAGNATLPGCIKTFAYWDPAILSSRYLLNAQTGELLAVQIQSLGQPTIRVRGKDVSSRHYRITTDKFTIDLWYSTQHEWLALQSTTQSGAVLRYQLQ